MSFGTQQPHIASYVLVRDNDKYVFVLRSQKTGWMQGFYGLPAGKIEVNESATQAAIREAKEEVGITVKELNHVLTMHRFEVDNDYPEWVDFFFEVTRWEGELYNAEPHMHESIEWFAIDKLPENIIPNVRAALEAISSGKNFTEYGY